MPAPQELSQQIPPGQKLGCKSPRVGENFWCKSSGVHRGMVMDEIDTCISKLNRFYLITARILRFINDLKNKSA